MDKIVLRSITCHQPSEAKDEIYIQYRGNKIWPKDSKFQRITRDQTINLNLEIEAPTIWVEIELWEYDYMSKNDHLGDFVFKSSNYAGEYNSSLKVNDDWIGKASYSMKWEVVK